MVPGALNEQGSTGTFASDMPSKKNSQISIPHDLMYSDKKYLNEASTGKKAANGSRGVESRPSKKSLDVSHDKAAPKAKASKRRTHKRQKQFGNGGQHAEQLDEQRYYEE